MICNDVEVGVKAGLTSNNVAFFIQKASKYDAEVFVKKGKLKANAKSLLGLMSLRIANNDKVTLLADGLDANEAIKELGEYLRS